MKKILLVAVACLGMLTGTAQTTINGVKVEKTLTVENEEMVLNGAGMREKLWYDLYVGSLYLKSKTKDAKQIVMADQTMSIVLDITDENVTQSKMKEAVNDGFDESCTRSERKKIEGKISKFMGLFSDAIVEGDQFIITYIPGKGTMVSKNGKDLGVIDGMDFKKALFGIWLGDYPADDDLKAAMLGIED
jgi:hypothetical protein